MKVVAFIMGPAVPGEILDRGAIQLSGRFLKCKTRKNGPTSVPILNITRSGLSAAGVAVVSATCFSCSGL